MSSGKAMLASAAWCAALAAIGPPLRAGAPGPGFQWPAFQDIRYQEDWSVLAKRPEDAPRDFFDPIKYVPLNADGSWWASFGGQVRERLEVWRDFAFRRSGGNAEYLQSRFRLHGDFHFTPAFRFFLELKSAHTTDRELPMGRRPLDTDVLDIQNAFVEWNLFPSNEAKVTLRAGRQELAFGKQRLISPLDWGNSRRTFDALSATLQLPAWTLTAFCGRVVIVEQYRTNRSDDDTHIYGVYASHKLSKALTLDIYGLGFKNEAAAFNGTMGTERRWTLGTRLGGGIAGTGFDFDLEGAVQFGTIGGQDIRACMLASQLGYTFAKAPATPRVFIGFD